MAEKPLRPIEKIFLLHVERGDCTTVKRLLREYKNIPEKFSINCVDPLNRSGLVIAIENENIQLIRILLEADVEVKDALLHAIKEEYIEAVELLLEWEEKHHTPNQSYSWEINCDSSAFTPDITPLILAAHKNNYEIVKLLLDRGATLPFPHNVKCDCDECIVLSKADSLRHSQARINAYRALISPSLIALSSKDPLLTAFDLSQILRRLIRMESEFCKEYKDMRDQVQNFSTSLLDFVRTSQELEIMLNYNPHGEIWDPGERYTLERLKLAIKYKQKMFVAHPNVQQLLSAIWYEGVPGFRRKKILGQIMQIVKLFVMFPIYCLVYIIAPSSTMGQFMKKPFVKFVCHSASYMLFLTLVSMASQRLEIVILELIGTDKMIEIVEEWKEKERGAFFGLAESIVIVYVASFVWAEVKQLWTIGLKKYISDLWNIIDFISYMFYILWIALRMSSWYVVKREASQGGDPWYPREEWHSFDPMLLSEGAFAAGMIFSFLKLVHVFSVSPHLGPLQISLGRMIFDIIKFFFIYTLVLFAFGCGLNQLLYYYAELEKNKCFSDGLADFENQEKACAIWRRYANLFETSQSLFWASFGLIDLLSFELTGLKSFTRFWALLMFGSYSVINIIILLNLFIAMMSNSYQIISERADIEWKFSRSRLWLDYFENGDTLPPPFNILPTPKTLYHCFTCNKHYRNNDSLKNKCRNKAKERYEEVMRVIIKRYITAEQQRRDIFGITEDDVREIRQDISTLRFELISILRRNGMNTPQVSEEDTQVSGKKDKIMERRILKDFSIGTIEGVLKGDSGTITSNNLFSKIVRMVRRKSRRSRIQDWNKLVRRFSDKQNPIGSTQERTYSYSIKTSQQNVLTRNTNIEEVEDIRNLHKEKFIQELTDDNSLKSSPVPRKVEPAIKSSSSKETKHYAHHEDKSNKSDGNEDHNEDNTITSTLRRTTSEVMISMDSYLLSSVANNEWI